MRREPIAGGFDRPAGGLMIPLLALAALASLVAFGLGEALFPLSIAAVLAYVLFPLIKSIEEISEKRFRSKVFGREFAVLTSLLIFIVSGVLLSLWVFPIVFKEGSAFFSALPKMIEGLLDLVFATAQEMGVELPFQREEALKALQNAMADGSVAALKSAGVLVGKALTSALGGLLFLLNLLLIPVFFFHLVSSYERITEGVRNLIPVRFRSNYDAFFEQVNRVVSAYFRGQLLVATILSVLYGTAFWMAGLSFGFVIGVLTGCLNVIPYVGPLVGLSTATIVSLSHFEGMGALLKVWFAFAIVQGLESFVITPRIVGDRVGLSALETMIAVIVGGNLGGFVGMVVAIPTAGIIRALLVECRRVYLRSEFYVRKPS